MTDRIAPIHRPFTREVLRVDLTPHPDWVAGSDRMPIAGEAAYCTEGLAQVVRVLGRTGDGSRLLELVLPDRPRQPFFAAASNVRIAPLASA